MLTKACEKHGEKTEERRERKVNINLTKYLTGNMRMLVEMQLMEQNFLKLRNVRLHI